MSCIQLKGDAVPYRRITIGGELDFQLGASQRPSLMASPHRYDARQSARPPVRAAASHHPPAADRADAQTRPISPYVQPRQQRRGWPSTQRPWKLPGHRAHSVIMIQLKQQLSVCRTSGTLHDLPSPFPYVLAC